MGTSRLSVERKAPHNGGSFFAKQPAAKLAAESPPSRNTPAGQEAERSGCRDIPRRHLKALSRVRMRSPWNRTAPREG